MMLLVAADIAEISIGIAAEFSIWDVLKIAADTLKVGSRLLSSSFYGAD